MTTPTSLSLLLTLPVRAAAGLLALFTLLVGALSVLPYEIPYQDELAAFLDNGAAAADCEAPCFLGIRPGQTKFPDAFMLLSRHPWVTDIRTGGAEYYDQWATWEWRGDHPAFIDTSRRGQMLTRYGTVSEIILPTRIPYGTVLHVLGSPQQQRQCYARGGFCHQPTYQDRALRASSEIDCRGSTLELWWQPVQLNLYQPEYRDNFQYVPYTLPLGRLCSDA